MFRGYVPPVQASKARAIVNLADPKKWACFASMSARKEGLFFCLERVGRSWHRRCDPARVDRLVHPRCEQCIGTQEARLSDRFSHRSAK